MRLWKIVLSISYGKANGAFAIEGDRWQVVHPNTHTHRKTSLEERRMWAKKQRNGLREHSLTSFAANINQFRAHLPPLYDVILTWCDRRVSNVRYRLVERYVAFLSSYQRRDVDFLFPLCVPAIRKIIISRTMKYDMYVRLEFHLSSASFFPTFYCFKSL